MGYDSRAIASRARDILLPTLVDLFKTEQQHELPYSLYSVLIFLSGSCLISHANGSTITSKRSLNVSAARRSSDLCTNGNLNVSIMYSLLHSFIDSTIFLFLLSFIPSFSNNGHLVWNQKHCTETPKLLLAKGFAIH